MTRLSSAPDDHNLTHHAAETEHGEQPEIEDVGGRLDELDCDLIAHGSSAKTLRDHEGTKNTKKHQETRRNTTKKSHWFSS